MNNRAFVIPAILVFGLSMAFRASYNHSLREQKPAYEKRDRVLNPETKRQLAFRLISSVEPLAPAIHEAAVDGNAAKEHWDKVNLWMACADLGICPAEVAAQKSNNPRDDFFYARDKVLVEMKWFIERPLYAQNEQARARKAVSHLLAFDDEKVRLHALQWALTLPPNTMVVDTILANFKDVVDPDLVRLMVLEFQRHIGTPREEPILAFVGEMLSEGGVYASRELARLSPLLVTDKNRSTFESWLKEMNQDTVKADLLKRGLETPEQITAMTSAKI